MLTADAAKYDMPLNRITGKINDAAQLVPCSNVEEFPLVM